MLSNLLEEIFAVHRTIFDVANGDRVVERKIVNVIDTGNMGQHGGATCVEN